MTLSKLEQPSQPQELSSPSYYYTVLPPQPPDENYDVLPYYFPGGRLRWCGSRRLCTGTASLVLLATLVYIFWPSDPDVKIVRMHVNHMQIHTIPYFESEEFRRVLHGLLQLGRRRRVQREDAGTRDVGSWSREGDGVVLC
ncbi:hypothetical protein V6N11_002841 [Hibiscus sabdariffa]|uniref:Uncharacterized protein n=1 Tax=Hibiscus sabdariffa TaxID=183260 RepID=A0ABR2SBM5_9ROSI